MTPLAAAAVWAGTGVLAAAVLPALRLRRLAVVVPLAGLVAVLTLAASGTGALPGDSPAGSLAIDRVAQGLLAAGAVALAAAMLLSPAVEAGHMRTAGLAGASLIIALAAGSALVWAAALVAGFSVLALRWIAAAPGRITFAAGRVALPGAAALLAAAPFLPITTALTGPRPVLISALLGCGLAALAGLLPLGGWAMGVLGTLPGIETVAWPVLLAPGVLLMAERLPAALPPVAIVYFAGIFTVFGLATAIWQAIQATRLAGRARYGRVVLADVALVAAAIGTGHPAQALPALLLLAVVHGAAAPHLLPGQTARSPARRCAWLLVSGAPPSPSFWGRLLVAEALTQSSFWAMVVALLTMVLLFTSVLLAARRAGGDDGITAPRLQLAAARVLGWSVLGAAAATGVAPGLGLSLIFGVR